MLSTLWRSLARPRGLFQDVAAERLRHPAWAFVLLVSIVTGFDAYVASVRADASLVEGLGRQAGFWTWTVLAAGFLFVSWLVLGLLIRMTAGLLAKPWAVAAYAQSPLVVTSLLSMLGGFFFASDATAIDLGTEGPQTARQALAEVLHTYRDLDFSQGLALSGSLWSLGLIYVGVRETAGAAKAWRSALLVLMVNIALTLSPLLLLLLWQP